MPAPFRIRGAARNQDQPWHSSPGTRRDECFLRLIRSGHGWFSDRLGTIDMLPGHCLLVTPEDPGLVRADPDDPYDFHRISYGGDYAEALTRRIVALRGRHFRVDDFHACEQLCQRIGGVTRAEMPEEMGLPEGLLAELLCRLLPTAGQDDDERLTREGLRHYIEEHAAEALSVDRLCSHFGVSQATLTRFCRQHGGRTPQQRIEDYRLELAEGLLRIPELTIAEVARRVGYADPFYFSRVFRKRMGASPRNWRQLTVTTETRRHGEYR